MKLIQAHKYMLRGSRKGLQRKFKRTPISEGHYRWCQTEWYTKVKQFIKEELFPVEKITISKEMVYMVTLLVNPTFVKKDCSWYTEEDAGYELQKKKDLYKTNFDKNSQK